MGHLATTRVQTGWNRSSAECSEALPAADPRAAPGAGRPHAPAPPVIRPACLVPGVLVVPGHARSACCQPCSGVHRRRPAGCLRRRSAVCRRRPAPGRHAQSFCSVPPPAARATLQQRGLSGRHTGAAGRPAPSASNPSCGQANASSGAAASQAASSTSARPAPAPCSQARACSGAGKAMRRRWQRLRTVGSRCSGSALVSSTRIWPGGSSSVFSSALAAAGSAPRPGAAAAPWRGRGRGLLTTQSMAARTSSMRICGWAWRFALGGDVVVLVGPAAPAQGGRQHQAQIGVQAGWPPGAAAGSGAQARRLPRCRRVRFRTASACAMAAPPCRSGRRRPGRASAARGRRCQLPRAWPRPAASQGSGSWPSGCTTSGRPGRLVASALAIRRPALRPPAQTACCTAAHTTSPASMRAKRRGSAAARRRSRAHALEEGQVLAFEAIGARARRRGARRPPRAAGRTTASGRAAGPAAPRLQLRQHGAGRSRGPALVGKGGIGEAVAQHGGPRPAPARCGCNAGGRAARRTPAAPRSARPWAGAAPARAAVRPAACRRARASAARSWPARAQPAARASMCEDLPAPSMPSKVMKRPRLMAWLLAPRW
jgi:hypothetical protein